MSDSDVGQYFGKYFLLKKLAAGGMGEVFLAKQQGPAGFEKILVVKKVLAHLTENKEFVELFLGEARLAARMNHRNIVQVFELGEEQSQYFIAMEYVQGKSLRDLIDAAMKRKEKIPAELCRSIAEQICDGSSYAHNLTDMTGRSLNLVHRDLNPQNVLISYTGDVKIIDFGIAKSEMSTVKTEAGMIKGKFVYMSPEQSLAKKLDKRSDIFAVGITLYEMLTQMNPFHKNNIVLTLEAVQRFDPPPPSEYDPQYAPFDPIIAKALAKDRDRRYSDAAEMQDDLRRIVLPRPPERLSQFMQRLFRQQVEEEQKALMDTDSSKVTGSVSRAGGRTPAKAVPATTPSRAVKSPNTVPEGPPPEGATMMLPSAPARAKGATPNKPVAPPAKAPPRPAAPARKAPQGAGDTMLDMGSPIRRPQSEPVSEDDAAGATAMLRPGQALPPPRRAAKPTDTVPEGDLSEEGESKTAFLGTAPARPERQRKAPAPNGGGTNILTPEESKAAQADALAKMQQAQQGAVRTMPRPRPGQPAPPRKSGKGLWIAIGVGGVIVVVGIVALVLSAFGDDAPAPKKRGPAPQAAHDVAPAEERPPPPPVEEKRAPPHEEPPPAPAPKHRQRDTSAEETTPPKNTPTAPEKHAEPKKIAAGKSFGTLTLNPGPNVPVAYAGNALPKQVGAFQLPITGESGSIEVGDGSTQFKVQLDYAREGQSLVFKVKSEPWAIASIDGPSRGKTPLSDVKIDQTKMTLLELKRPGQQNGMSLRLRYKPN